MNASLKAPMTQTTVSVSQNPLTKTQVVMPHWLRHVVFGLLTVLVLLYVLDRIYNPKNFQITQVSVHGELENIASSQIVEALQAGVQGNFFSVDLHDLSEYIKGLPWVFDASMRLVWPSTLHVTIEEVKPIARWDDEFWMHETGELVQRVESADDAYLPMLSGPQNMSEEIWQQYVMWQKAFIQYGIELRDLTLDERELWRMHLSADYFADVDASLGLVNTQEKITHEVDFVIPLENAQQRVMTFINAMQPQLLSQFLQMKKVDLRYPNGFAIAWDETRKVQQQIDDVDSEAPSQ